MEKLVSSWYKDQPLPESYIFPPDKRPGKLLVPKSNTVPVIDLADNRTDIIQQMLKASLEFGLFQVVNHGVPEKIISETRSVFKEVFEMPAEDKASLYSGDPSRCKLITSTSNYDSEKIHLWRDNLKHPCHPLEECIKFWPEKPTRYREVVAAYSIEANKLGSTILELLCEGLGIESGYFEDKLSEKQMLSFNHYPPCPDPSLTLGIPAHCDPGILAILHQGDVCGLQVFKDGEWIGVEPLPNAFVVNIAYQLQVISNNKLKSAEHRAVTNSSDARTSVVLFISPSGDSIIEPAKSLITATNPPLCRPFQSNEFLVNFLPTGKADLALQPFKLKT
ncbi:hyoscyamine 6-dioxygenase-like [Durio zibethinus]|uniref:Hyoscyamine 6-dioxygenase-like n=1 Tax=Durio zibethinus TaxID=66656 RepID=A0A6P6B2K3_DURZI|nr:hyoscyamine 6-dioxygenase-like [Durio zibethinus]